MTKLVVNIHFLFLCSIPHHTRLKSNSWEIVTIEMVTMNEMCVIKKEKVVGSGV